MFNSLEGIPSTNEELESNPNPKKKILGGERLDKKNSPDWKEEKEGKEPTPDTKNAPPVRLDSLSKMPDKLNGQAYIVPVWWGKCYYFSEDASGLVVDISGERTRSVNSNENTRNSLKDSVDLAANVLTWWLPIILRKSRSVRKNLLSEGDDKNDLLPQDVSPNIRVLKKIDNPEDFLKVTKLFFGLQNKITNNPKAMTYDSNEEQREISVLTYPNGMISILTQKKEMTNDFNNPIRETNTNITFYNWSFYTWTLQNPINLSLSEVEESLQQTEILVDTGININNSKNEEKRKNAIEKHRETLAKEEEIENKKTWDELKKLEAEMMGLA